MPEAPAITNTTISNSKLASIDAARAVWAPHAGFTLLFDNPDIADGGLRDDGHGQLLTCRYDKHADQALYGALAAWMQAQNPAKLRRDLGFCAMPPSTYHVTAWDGLNVAVLPKANAETQSAMQPWFDDLPVAAPPDAVTSVRSTQAALNAMLPIRFAFDALRSSTGVGIVADLKPADAEQAERFAAFQAQRLARAEQHEADWGWAYTTPLEPHITLGYFPNADCGRAVEAQMLRWDDELRSTLDGLTLEFTQIGLYSFTDMVRFYRVPNA
ncbi:hypothetical protein GYB61_00445 [bacterium]|nr:hypothetical protein [bacterium]